MPTINSIVQRNNLVADVSHKYFKLDAEAAEKSVLVGAPIRTNADFLHADFSGQPAITDLVENYSADKEDFQTKMQDKLDSLQKSSERLKDSVAEDEEFPAAREETSDATSSAEETRSTLSTLENFARSNVPPRAKILAFQPVETKSADEDKTDEIAKQVSDRAQKKNNITDFAEKYLARDEDRNATEAPKVETAEENLVSRVENFVSHYNSVLSYLNEHREMSDRVSALAENFSTNTNLQSSLSSIGISVREDGALSVNGVKLLNALENDSSALSSLLGNLDRNLNLANQNQQNDKLFPTIDEYSGEEQFEAWENLYARQNSTSANYAQQKSGKILNMFS